jgi:homoserine O-acetyltransferase
MRQVSIRSISWKTTILSSLLFCAGYAFAGAPVPRPDTGGPHTPEHQIAALGGFRFESGETIGDLKVSYVTHGKLNAAHDNAILALHGCFFDHHHLDWLIGPGKAVDSDKYFVVVPDFLGNQRLRSDVTTGPTNSGLKMRFPRITARDWVNADFRFVKEYLGIDHVVAAVGLSCGGIRAFQLAVSHPDFAASVVVAQASPHTNPQTQLFLRHINDVLALDPGWYGGMYEINPVAGVAIADAEFSYWLYSPGWYQKNLATAEKLRDFEALSLRGAALDARNSYYTNNCWADFNLGDTPGFNGDTKAALGAIKAKTLLIAIKEDLLVRREEMLFAKNAIRDATYVEISSPFGHINGLGGFDPRADETYQREIRKFLSAIE